MSGSAKAEYTNMNHILGDRTQMGPVRSQPTFSLVMAPMVKPTHRVRALYAYLFPFDSFE